MPGSTAAMTAALRILTAIVAREQPDTADVNALQEYLAPLEANEPLDEVACDAILKALRERSRLRCSSGSSGR